MEKEKGFVYGFVNSGQGCWKCTSIKFAIKLKFSSVQFSLRSDLSLDPLVDRLHLRRKSTAIGDGLVKAPRTSTSPLRSGDGDDVDAVPVTPALARHRRSDRDDP